ncbi:MAG: AAA family ATPase, partial [Chlamydiota bacterium]
MKRLALGVSDYKEIVEFGYSYIDKTLLVEEILESGTKVFLIARPRRFGKTLNLSMLRYFFEKTEKDHSFLFQNFKIWKRKYREEQGRYPVISLSFKEIKNSTWESAYKDLKLLISTEFTRHRFLLEVEKENKPLLQEEEKELFYSILTRQGDETIFKSSLKLLTLWLERYYQKKSIVLLDEYDTPIQSSYLYAYYDSMIEFMRGWLAGGLKDNSCLEKAVLTGILRVSKESVFSGLNNLGCYTLLDEEFGDKFGFVEEEVISLLQEHSTSCKIEDIRKWYNGYAIGSHAIYNPWSIIQCIQKKGELRPYWVNTSDNELIKKLIIQGDSSLKMEVEKLLLSEVITKPVDEGTVFKSLDNQMDAIFGLFLFSGYLTLAGKPVYKSGALECPLKIPNQEIADLYKVILKEWMVKTLPSNNLALLLQSLTTGDIPVFTEMLQTLILNTMSYYDVPKDEPERVYHAFVLGLLVSLEETYEVKSNRESGFGRYDVCLIPKDPLGLGIILECKKVKEAESLSLAAEDALKQI